MAGSSSLSTRAKEKIFDMAGIKEYVVESFDELKNKVSWPTWQELQSSAIVVFIATAIISIIVYAMDLVFGQLLDFIYNNVF